MARLRTLKPGFFIDEYLAECQPLTRLLFAGLWTIADREGRLEDRPRRIKAECLPYDDCDVDALLNELAQHGFIVRYGLDGGRFIAVPTWHKHQSPHMKESASTIPAPDEHGASTNLAPDEPPSSCLVSCLVSGNHKEPLSDSDESNGVRNMPAEFEELWKAYGGVGNKGKALDCYRWWRQFGHAASGELLTAVRNYVAHCQATESKIMHTSTFLARSYPPTKNHPGKSARWPEWAAGEEHGSMDARGTTRVADVVEAAAQAFGLIGDDFEQLGEITEHRPAGNIEGNQDASGGLPARRLAG